MILFNGDLRQVLFLNQPESFDEEVAKVEHGKGVHPIVIRRIAVSFAHHQHKSITDIGDDTIQDKANISPRYTINTQCITGFGILSKGHLLSVS